MKKNYLREFLILLIGYSYAYIFSLLRVYPLFITRIFLRIGLLPDES